MTSVLLGRSDRLESAGRVLPTSEMSEAFELGFSTANVVVGRGPCHLNLSGDQSGELVGFPRQIDANSATRAVVRVGKGLVFLQLCSHHSSMALAHFVNQC